MINGDTRTIVAGPFGATLEVGYREDCVIESEKDEILLFQRRTGVIEDCFSYERLSQQGKSGLANEKVVLLLESAVATKNQSNMAVLKKTLLIAINNKDYLH